jgi:hypothetical protein
LPCVKKFLAKLSIASSFSHHTKERLDLSEGYITVQYTVATVQGMVWFGTALVLSGLAMLLSTVSGLSPSAKEKGVS